MAPFPFVSGLELEEVVWMMTDNAVAVIEDYISTYLFPPMKNWPEYYFKERTYARWIANDILEAIKAQPWIPPVDIVEEFYDKVDEYASLGALDDRIFAMARETVEEIGCLLV